MTIEFTPLPLPDSAEASNFLSFGRQVTGFDPTNFTAEEFATIEDALYKHDLLLFRNVDLSPEKQYMLNRAFESDDPACDDFGHGNNEIDKNKNSILHPDLKTIPRVPQIQLLGNGTIYNHEGITHATLKHPSHTTFHKTRVSPVDEAKGTTRFFRWHIDAALYDRRTPKVTTLYAINVPKGPKQTCRYDDGTGDELPVPLGTTAFVSGKTMFDILPSELKSLAVRSKAKYAPLPYVWMAPAHAVSTGLGLESEDLEIPYDQLPPWEEAKRMVLPVLWKNPVTGELHLQVHPCGVVELLVDPIPEGGGKEGVLYPDGVHLTDLKAIRELLYEMQRPGIAPKLVYPHDWNERDVVLFHNRGVLHSVVGAFNKDQIRTLHQCNLVASDNPSGPTTEDVKKWS
ncbi:Clavaminate synthase-like protein [Guyanagaster necrorhizus]|uniref:Clavaminate synthase-like protein n=1 Tax=Guyanagaster necrorhizus TaxID=856835 RepID=A0A9P7W5U9_9AGAR|nr:Clavaminate synthase-like protein [Guyanagaster necrorhizus MCA 3950]KAG7451826.1 Clavaminate synthase-like protein [Guyanagaster necrorhizus MCA 3950]